MSDFFIFNENCLVCRNKKLDYNIPLCIKCFKKLVFVGNMFCKKCGKALKKNEICNRCNEDEYYPEYIRSVVYYNEPSASLIKNFKYGGIRIAADFMTSLMLELIENESVFSDIDCLTYIPFGYFKKYNRFYNHSEVLCRVLSHLTGLPVKDDLIKAKSILLSQAKLPHFLRKKRTGLFKEGKTKFTGKILVIDDVLTTGRTLSEAAETIKKNNPDSDVFGLTFAVS